jgi:hypothetical protein
MRRRTLLDRQCHVPPPLFPVPADRPPEIR